MGFVIRGLIGGLIVLLMDKLAKSEKSSRLVGLVPLFPALGIIAAIVVYDISDSANKCLNVRSLALGNLPAIIAYLFYLRITRTLLLKNKRRLFAMSMGMFGWFLITVITITFNYL